MCFVFLFLVLWNKGAVFCNPKYCGFALAFLFSKYFEKFAKGKLGPETFFCLLWYATALFLAKEKEEENFDDDSFYQKKKQKNEKQISEDTFMSSKKALLPWWCLPHGEVFFENVSSSFFVIFLFFLPNETSFLFLFLGKKGRKHKQKKEKERGNKTFSFLFFQFGMPILLWNFFWCFAKKRVQHKKKRSFRSFPFLPFFFQFFCPKTQKKKKKRKGKPSDFFSGYKKAQV